MMERDIVCRYVMILGLAIHGEGLRALRLFSEIEMVGVKPDNVTFITVFTACSDSGMEHEGLRLFYNMCNEYNINPKTENYICIIDFLGRAYIFNETEDIRMPTCCSLKEKAVAWGLDKAPGCSSIEVGGVVNEFVSGEKTHHRIEEIHTLLENLNRQLDYSFMCLVLQYYQL
ncbi:pentatricopeptide repeat-containing protein [Tanacetum coccineum]